jgi:hypothetical protein
LYPEFRWTGTVLNTQEMENAYILEVQTPDRGTGRFITIFKTARHGTPYSVPHKSNPRANTVFFKSSNQVKLKQSKAVPVNAMQTYGEVETQLH